MSQIQHFPLLLAEQFAADLRLAYDPAVLDRHFGYGEVPALNDPAEVMNHLAEIGANLNLVFVQHRVQPGRVAELFHNQVLPVLAFPGEEKGALYLREMRGRNVSYLQFRGSEYFEGGRDSQELIDELERVAQEQGELAIITALPITPTFSNEEDENGFKEKLTPIQRFWRLILAERRDITYVMVYAFAIGLLGLTLPLGIQATVNRIAGGVFIQSVVVLIVFVIAGTLFSGILQIYQMRVVEILQQRVFTRAGFEFAFRIPRLRHESLDNYYAPELINRFFDIVTIQKGFSKLFTDFVTSLINILFGLILLSFYHPFFVFFDIILIAVVVIIFRTTGPRGLRSSIEESNYKYKVAHWLEELGRTMVSFKMAGFTNLALDRMDGVLTKYLRARKTHFNVLVTQFSALVFFKTAVVGGVLILGSVLVIDKQITLGQFVAAEVVIILVMNGIEKVIQSMDQIYDMLTAADKVGKVTDLPLDPNRGALINAKTPSGIEIDIQNLKYTYATNQAGALEGISLHIKSGARIAILGVPGGGKSTFFRVLTGMLQDYSGAVSFDRVLLRDINSVSLRDVVGECLGSDAIFDGTLMENISVGKPGVTMQDVQFAIDAAGLRSFVNGMPQGLSSPIVASGQQISENDRKRIILARAIAERPRLLLIDEGFIPKEPYANNCLLPEVFSPKQHWTVIAATTHPCFLERADRIYLFQEGRIAFEGDWNQLKNDGRLYEMVRSIS